MSLYRSCEIILQDKATLESHHLSHHLASVTPSYSGYVVKNKPDLVFDGIFFHSKDIRVVFLCK